MSVRPPEISYEPYFYPPRPDLVFPNLVFPEHRRILIEEGRSVLRYIYPGYEIGIRDQLEAHFHRVCKLGLVWPSVGDRDRQEVYSFHQIHDVGELEKSHDLTALAKKEDPEAAALAYKEEEETARKRLTAEDFVLWQEYEKAKPLLEGLPNADPEVNPNAVLAKLFDVYENETYHHTWIQYLWEIYELRIFDMFPPRNFNFSFPRLRKYQRNIVKIALPESHLVVAHELFAGTEAFAKISFQRDI